jgi:hypothetical protein
LIDHVINYGDTEQYIPFWPFMPPPVLQSETRASSALFLDKKITPFDGSVLSQKMF